MPRGHLLLGAVLCACGTPGGGETTDTESSGEPPPECSKDDECPDRCFEGMCVEGCSVEIPCPGLFMCVANACAPPVPVPVECPGSLTIGQLFTVALAGGAASKVGAADIEGDGATDLLAVSEDLVWIRGGDLAVSPISGGGMVGPIATNVGDIDGDGHVDILPRNGDVVLFGDGAGGFVEAPGPDLALIDGALGDLDGDGRADMVGFRYACPLDAPPETECSGETPARYMRGEGGWEQIFQGMIWGPPRNVLVAPVLAGGAPVGVYESSFGFVVLGTFTAYSWPVEVMRVESCDYCGWSLLVAVRRAGDDRAELLHVDTRVSEWSWGARLRSDANFEFPDQWALPGRYRGIAAGDIDQDGNDDVALVGPKVLLMLDREEEPIGNCLVELPLVEPANAVALADLDGDARPELILGTEPGLAVYSLQWSP